MCANEGRPGVADKCDAEGSYKNVTARTNVMLQFPASRRGPPANCLRRASSRNRRRNLLVRYDFRLRRPSRGASRYDSAGGVAKGAPASVEIHCGHAEFRGN